MSARGVTERLLANVPLTLRSTLRALHRAMDERKRRGRVMGTVWVGLVVAACGAVPAEKRDPRQPDASAASPETDAAGDGVASGGEGGTGQQGDGSIVYVDSGHDAGGPCTEDIDVVFVLDISSSMLPAIAALRAEMGAIVQAANTLAPGSRFGFVPLVDNHRFDTGGVAAGGKVHLTPDTIVGSFDYFVLTYTLFDRNPGDPPNGPTQQNPLCEENSLDALYAAATEFPWRPESTRLVVVATDDTFLEAPDNYGDRDGDGKTNKKDFPKEGNYPALRTLGQTTEALLERRIRVFSFTRTTPPGPVDLLCGVGRRLAPSEVSAGWSKSYGGNPPIPQVTGGKNLDLLSLNSGQASLATMIGGFMSDSHCNPPSAPR